jgi:RNA polymerase sigma-70 factor (ECF subfamily)
MAQPPDWAETATKRAKPQGRTTSMQRDLVLLAQKGDVEAYSTLTLAQVDRMHAAARLILRTDDRAADAVQDALLRAWVDLRALRDPDRFEAWLFRILVRTCYAAASRARSRTIIELRASVRPEASVSDDQESLAVRDQLDRGFARLSTDHRTVIVLVHYLGFSLADAAQAIGVPIGTVQSRLSRATQALRAAIEADQRPIVPVAEVAG